MAIMVKNKNTNEKYVLLGSGLGMYKSSRPSFFLGNLLPTEDEGVMQVVSVCNKQGEILFIEKDLLKVVEIDNVAIEDMKDAF